MQPRKHLKLLLIYLLVDYLLLLCYILLRSTQLNDQIYLLLFTFARARAYISVAFYFVCGLVGMPHRT